MLSVKVLGELQLELDGALLSAPARKSGRLLVGYLALHPGLHARGDLAATLWPEVVEESARGSLRAAIASLRRALGPEAGRYLVIGRDAVGLASPDAGVTVDCDQFEALIAAGEIEAALALIRGPLLQGLDAAWVRQERAEHLERVSDLLGELTAQAEQRGDPESAVRYARRRVSLEPLAEPPNRDLIRLLTAVGDRASAIAVYGELAERFRRDLHALPSPQTRRLVEQARAGSPQQPEADTLPLPAAFELMIEEPFVNRGDELSVLSGMLSAAVDGKRQVMLIAGEPGIGKSVLAATFAAAARAAATVVVGRCRRPPSSAFEPFVEALRHYVENVPVDRLERELPPAVSELSGLVPAIADRLTGMPLPLDLLDDGERNARAFIETLRSLCRARPLLVVIEDLHRAESDTIAVIGQLLAAPQPFRLMMVLTVREAELARSPTLQRLAREIRAGDGGAYAELRGIDAAALAALAKDLGSDLAADELTRLHARTGGNPLFAAQLLRHADSFASWPFPQRIEDLIEEELSQLSEDAQACLAVASVIGVSFELRTVATLAAQEEAHALNALEEAIAAQLISECGTAVGRYQFRHELIREAIYGRLSATRRAYLHRDLAALLIQEIPANEASAQRSIIDHLRNASTLVERGELADRLLAAGKAAESERTFGHAAALYAEAAELLSDQPQSGERRCVALTKLAHARRRAGEADDVEALFLEAGMLAQDLKRVDLLEAAALGLCSIPHFAGDRAPNPSVHDLLRDSLSSASDSSTRARLLAKLASERYYDLARPRPDQLAQAAIAEARRSRNASALRAVLDVGHLLAGPNSAGERITLAEELSDLARAEHDAENLVQALVHKTISRAQLGELSALRAGAGAMTALADELHQPAYRWWAELWLASTAIVAGELEEGTEAACRAFEGGRTAFGSSAELELRAQLLWTRIEQGQVDQLADALPALQASFSLLPVWTAVEARVLAEPRSRSKGRKAMELTALGLSRLQRDTNWLISASLLAETVARTGDTSAAQQLYRALEPWAEQWAVSARGTVCLGPITGSLSLAAGACGQADDAEHYYATALEQCTRAGATAARTRLEREYHLARDDGTQSRQDVSIDQRA